SGETRESDATFTSFMVSTPSETQAVESATRSITPLFVFIDSDCLNDPLRFWPGQIDRQQPVLQIRPEHMHSLRQHEGALEVARGDAAMNVLPGLVVLLAATDDELVFLNGDIELVTGETRHRQRDPKTLGL